MILTYVTGVNRQVTVDRSYTKHSHGGDNARETFTSNVYCMCCGPKDTSMTGR